MKRILVIDDDAFYLHLIEKHLNNLHYYCTICENLDEAKLALKEQEFDLILCDLYLGNISSENFIKNFKSNYSINTPIIVLSCEKDTALMERILSNGAQDYITKPVSLNVLTLKVSKALGVEQKHPKTKEANTIINEKSIGVVIPCYNEEDRLESEEFKKQVWSNSSCHLCFVNDGSSDNTKKILNQLQLKDPFKISVINLEKNVGKAEAVRRGILYLNKEKKLDYIGFLDADLSTNFSDFSELANLIEAGKYDIVFGSRINRAGAIINKESKRSIISYIINRIIVSIIKIDIKDTQCGAKIFTTECATELFKNSFQSRWLFDVELFIRLKDWKNQKLDCIKILEHPLNMWIHKDGSKLGFKDSLKIIFELVKIKKHYNRKKTFAYKNNYKKAVQIKEVNI